MKFILMIVLIGLTDNSGFVFGVTLFPHLSNYISIFVTIMIINRYKNIYYRKNIPNLNAVSLVTEANFLSLLWENHLFG